MIRALIFDCFGVLYTGSFSALRDHCPAERWHEAEDLNKQADYGYISRQEYLQQMAEVVGMDSAKLDEMLMGRHVRNTSLVEYVKQCRGQYKVGLLSNVSDELIERLFSKQELDELFDMVMLSSRVGIAKPNPEIYTLAAERLGVVSSECIMIDDLSENCDGAEVAGMQSVQHTQTATTIARIAEIVDRERA